jgi:hypothetical protein
MSGASSFATAQGSIASISAHSAPGEVPGVTTSNSPEMVSNDHRVSYFDLGAPGGIPRTITIVEEGGEVFLWIGFYLGLLFFPMTFRVARTGPTQSLSPATGAFGYPTMVTQTAPGQGISLSIRATRLRYVSVGSGSTPMRGFIEHDGDMWATSGHLQQWQGAQGRPSRTLPSTLDIRPESRRSLWAYQRRSICAAIQNGDAAFGACSFLIQDARNETPFGVFT